MPGRTKVMPSMSDMETPCVCFFSPQRSRTLAGRIAVTDLAKGSLRPQNGQEELIGLREAVLKAPEISAVYSHYRGENLPDMQFFDNALVDKFGIPEGQGPRIQNDFLRHTQ